MDRRTFLAVAAVSVAAGCLDNASGDSTGGTTSNEDTGAERRQFVSCEEQYIRTEVVDDDERIDGSLDPTVVELDARDTGVYAELRTTFGTIKSSEDSPDQRVDYEVTAYYYRGDDGTFRTEDPDEDSTNGTRIQCG
ncbi:hypothetical protein [Haloarchaeobius litoreus]|uniref:Uncharacterized protein n=1 Tax=Haloarchaeobius litoreus TaxID=755306 RepID=A0ABD6DJK6_9EURY|nr:hypothetical protein [Haloarchaeobius litoreus]